MILAERADEIGFGGYVLYQDSDAFCYGVDAVLLADFCDASEKDTVLDLCCGNGAVSLVIEAKYHPKQMTGLELQEDAVRLAKKSAAANGLADKLSFICGDAVDIEKYFKGSSFDLVACNPPYFEGGRGIDCAEGAKQLARHESTAGLKDFLRAAGYVLKKGGRLCMIHRPERLADLMELSRRCGLEPKKLRMIVPHKGEAANMVLVQFVKGGGKGLAVLPELAVRNGSGGFTEDIDRIYGRTAG